MVNYRILGKSGLKVTEIGLGCWAIGGPSFSDDGQPNGWAGADDQASVKGLLKAYELGINHWDSADAYGKGHSERLIGKVFIIFIIPFLEKMMNILNRPPKSYIA
jgi:myo-inositol catabolism protein IolS